MTDYINEEDIRNEVTVFLKNEDILTTSERGVVTVTGTSLGTLSSVDSTLIDKHNIRNVRGITVDGSLLSFGKDYTVDYYYLDGTSRKCKIDFTGTVSGVSTVTYDYGDSEKIYPDFPRTDMTLANYPRVGLEVIDITTSPYGFGNVNNSNVDISFTIVDDSKDKILDIMNNIRKSIIDNQNDLYYLKLVKPNRTGPVIRANESDTKAKNKLFSKSMDIRAYFNLESNN